MRKVCYRATKMLKRSRIFLPFPISHMIPVSPSAAQSGALCSTEPKLLFFGAQALYIGPSFGLSAHRNAVAVLCAGLGGSFGVANDPTRAAAGCVTCRTALIKPNSLHRLEISSSPMAFFYLDPLSVDSPILEAAMRDDYGRFSTGIANEARVLAALREIADGLHSPSEARAVLYKALTFGAPIRQDERIFKVIQRLRENPAESNSLQSLASAVGLSPSRFLHLFKQETGVPLRRYRIWTRMGAAIRHIGGGMSLTDSALAAGFSSSAHFSAAFRDMFGMQPSRLAGARLGAASRP
ncbi:helix-turn-helix domain-containing protein [soil metagenome]